MSRFLIATEGPVDEVVIHALCEAWCAPSAIDEKRFPARGIEQVMRLVPDIVRAAHFGYYDVLVIHADADATPEHVHGHDEADCRTCRLRTKVSLVLEQVGSREGMAPLLVVVAIPKQTTDAWLLWGRDNGDGRRVEQMSRHEVKARVFEGARFDQVARARVLVPSVLARWTSEAPMRPPSLVALHQSLTAPRG